MRLRSVHLAGDEGLHYLPCVISLWPRLRNPLVLATFEQLVLDIAAGISIGLRESLLYRRKNVVVESTLHYQEWHLCDCLVPVEDLLRIAFVDRVPGDEERRVVLDHGAALQLFRILVAGAWRRMRPRRRLPALPSTGSRCTGNPAAAWRATPQHGRRSNCRRGRSSP